ncbi:DUF4153 domain-containing protein [Stenotrophomonas sp.]|uniref:DUF4153 domain-containing protein n=1 Tax=Stenotrophomonas sp. TaxID=69392 RepID=UPI002898A017|nr:DUF4153 domain-containing protein [Stenotrophomonas sp.]
MNDTTLPALPLSSRSTIVLIALLQGLALYAVQQANDSWPFQDIASRYRWYTWVLTIPTAVALTLVTLRDRRLWLHAIVGSVVVLALASWIGWNLGGGATGLVDGPLHWPFSLSMGIAVFVTLPWWQFRLQHGHWRATYDALFERAWQNGLTLALALAFTGLTWLLLWLWAALFQLVDIDFFRDLFREEAFISLATGCLFGFGVLIGRTQHRAIQVTRQVLFAICRGLLPLLSFIAVLFVLSLPFTGLEALWKTRSATWLLVIVSLLLVAFTNAVYQHDSARAAYPMWLRRLVDASLLALPVYAGLALYAMGLRIAQYGWTLERFWGALVVVMVLGYAVGYALSVLRRRGRWLQPIETVNRWMCWTVLAVALLANSPVLDGVRISVASQVARLKADPAAINAADAIALRFEFGRRGVDALRTLEQDPRLSADARAVSVVKDALARKERWGGERQVDDGLRDLTVLQRQVELAQGSPAADADWWQGLLDRKLDAGGCLESGASCVALRRDFDGDGIDDMLLCDLSEYIGPSCRLHARPPGTSAAAWQNAGQISFYDGGGKDQVSMANTALREGKLEAQQPRWPQLKLAGIKARSLDESRVENVEDDSP